MSRDPAAANHGIVRIEAHDMTTTEKIIQEVQRLPEPVAREVLDFIGHIELKHGLRDQLTEEPKQAQETAMKHIWDNPEDEVWNDL